MWPLILAFLLTPLLAFVGPVVGFVRSAVFIQGASATVTLALLGWSTAAAADGSAVAVDDWSGLLIDLAIPAGLAILAFVARHVADWFHLKADSIARGYLEHAAAAALSLAYARAGVKPGQALAEAQIATVTEIAAAYLRSRVPDALKRFRLDDDVDAFLTTRIIERDRWAPGFTPPGGAARGEVPFA